MEANITPRAESPINLYADDSLTSAVVNKSNKTSVPSTNPFDDYDEKKNPFYESDDGNDENDDYDESLNPFAS